MSKPVPITINNIIVITNNCIAKTGIIDDSSAKGFIDNIEEFY
tara:strand:+ start:37 stop:165 length:129 start_codon:yes stop_codon:yes gene_type:complete